MWHEGTTKNLSLRGVYFTVQAWKPIGINEAMAFSITISHELQRAFPFSRLAGRGRVVRVEELAYRHEPIQRRLGLAVAFGEDLTALAAASADGRSSLMVGDGEAQQHTPQEGAMSEVLLPMVEEEWKKPPIDADPAFPPPEASTRDASLMSPLGVVEGEVLMYLEEHGATTLRQLTRELAWPASMVMMAVGALVRESLARAVQHELEIVIEPWKFTG
jgi:hypothetical protein